MKANVDLGSQLEQVVTDLVDGGRYSSRDEVLRKGVELVLAREVQLAELDAAIAAGLADVEAGRTVDADELFDELIARYSNMSRAAE